MKRLRLIRRAVSLAIVSVLGVALSTTAVLAVENAGIGGKPANPRPDNPRSQSIFVYELKPGERMEDAVEVVNNTDKEKTLLIYAVDSQVASDGAFACAQKADESVGVGTWIKLSKGTVTLAPQATEDVQFSISVPKTASSGEQNGCIAIQDSEQSAASQSNGVSLSFRSAIRVAVTIPGDITKQLDFSGPVLIRLDKETIRLSVGLKNNGNVSLDTGVDARMKNIFGGTVRMAGGTFPVLARSEAAFNFEVKKPFWGGWYRVAATATYGSELEQSLGEVGQTQAIASPDKWIFVTPEPLALAVELAGAAVIAGGALAIILYKRRYKKLHTKAALYKVKDNESLQSIAKKYDVSWKVIARLNKLRAPYHIEPGQVLKIPARTSRDTQNDKHAKSD